MPRVKPRPAPTPAPLPDRPGRWKLLLRRQRRLLRPTAFATLVFGALLLAIGVIHILGRGPTLSARLGRATAALGLVIKDPPIVEGREKTPKPLLDAALGIVPGEPILTYSVAEARQRLLAIAWIRAATVERLLPGTIRVVLDERRPMAIWQNQKNQSRFSLIDRTGDRVADGDIADMFGKIPIVVGEGANTAAAALLDAMIPFPDLQGRMVAAIRVGARRWNLCMTSGAEVLLPEGAEPQGLAKLAELQAGKQLLDRPLQEIDLRLPDRLRVTPLGSTPCGQTQDQTPAASRAAPALSRKAT